VLDKDKRMKLEPTGRRNRTRVSLLAILTVIPDSKTVDGVNKSLDVERNSTNEIVAFFNLEMREPAGAIKGNLGSRLPLNSRPFTNVV